MHKRLHKLIFRARSVLILSTMMWLVSASLQASEHFLPLSCLIGLEATAGCSGVPVIERAALMLESSGHFILTAHYAACYQVDDVTAEGVFKVFPHDNGADIELLAIKSTGSLQIRQPGTIGLINLDTKTLNGRFTDLAALIRSRGQLKSAPVLSMQCEYLKNQHHSE